jgi:hypothetical protein
MPKMKSPDFIFFSSSKEQRYGLIIDKYQSHNTSSLILKINTLPYEHLRCAMTVAIEKAYKLWREFNSCSMQETVNT